MKGSAASSKQWVTSWWTESEVIGLIFCCSPLWAAMCWCSFSWTKCLLLISQQLVEHEVVVPPQLRRMMNSTLKRAEIASPTVLSLPSRGCGNYSCCWKGKELSTKCSCLKWLKWKSCRLHSSAQGCSLLLVVLQPAGCDSQLEIHYWYFFPSSHYWWTQGRAKIAVLKTLSSFF